MNTVKAKIQEENNAEFEAEVELHLEQMRGIFEPDQFVNSGYRLTVPQSSFNLSMPDGNRYRCAMLIATHFEIIEASLAKTA